MSRKALRVLAQKVTRRGGKREGAGRPPGARSVLPQGVAKPLKLMSGLPTEVLEIPQVKAAIDKIEQIMLGKHRNRHVQTELQACSMIIEFYAGKPKARHEHDTGPTLAEMLARASEKT